MFFIENENSTLVFGNVLKIIRDLLTYLQLARRKRNLFFFNRSRIIANSRMFFEEFGNDDYYREKSPLPKFMVQLSDLYERSKIATTKKNKLLFDFFISMLAWIDTNNPATRRDFIASFFTICIYKFQPSEFVIYLLAHKAKCIEPIEYENPLYTILVSDFDCSEYLSEFLGQLNEDRDKLKAIYASLIEACLDHKHTFAQEKMDLLRIIFVANQDVFVEAINLLPDENEHQRVVTKLASVDFADKYTPVFDFLNVEHVQEYTNGEKRVSYGATDCSVESMSVALAALSSKYYFSSEPPVIISMGADNTKAYNLFYFFQAIYDNKNILNGVHLPFICESYHWFSGVASIADDKIKVVIVDSRDFLSHFIINSSNKKNFLFDLIKYLRYGLNFEFYIHSTQAQRDCINCSKFSLFNLRELAKYVADDIVYVLHGASSPIKFFLPTQSMSRVNELMQLPQAAIPIKKSFMTFREHFTPAFKVAGIRAACQPDVTGKEINTTIVTKSSAMLYRIFEYLDDLTEEEIATAVGKHSLDVFLENIHSSHFTYENYSMEEYIGSVMDDFIEDLAKKSLAIPEDWYTVLHGTPILKMKEAPPMPAVKRPRMAQA